MKNRFILVILGSVMLLSACSSLPPVQTPTATATYIPPVPTLTTQPTQTPGPTATPIPSPTPAYPPAGLGPTSFPPGFNPLTGLAVSDPNLLNRRTIAIKVENLPRSDRPQWGLTKTDLVYEYYTEEGTTRFIAIFYGHDTAEVGPIRSGRFFDVNVVQAYKSVFIFGSAWAPVFNRFLSSDFGNRLLVEGSSTSPALYRYDSNGTNFLFADTTKLPDVLTRRGVDNKPQNLDGMYFRLESPTNGQSANSVFVRYSSAIYNRWDYDATTGKYLRFVDQQTDITGNEVYGPLVDRIDNSQISADNLVMITVQHDTVVKTADAEVIDMTLLGKGDAWIARDGQLYKVTWSRPTRDSVLTLLGSDGQPFPFKPGNTWFEILGLHSTLTQVEASTWRFKHVMP